MKKAVLILSLASVLMIFRTAAAFSQEKPQPKKDTVNMDTDAKPTFYYAVEDEKEGAANKKSGGSGALIAIIAGAVVVIGAGAFFVLKKKK
jgi:LPXTG-motif cell wall-anchored protein